MGKGRSGHKQNMAAKRNRAKYKLLNQREVNKKRKAEKEQRKNLKLKEKGKGPLVKEEVNNE